MNAEGRQTGVHVHACQGSSTLHCVYHAHTMHACELEHTVEEGVGQHNRFTIGSRLGALLRGLYGAWHGARQECITQGVT